MSNFSDYIISVDESGDHGLTTINQQNPIFTLVFCIFRKDIYSTQIVPALQNLKFEFWGHDGAIFHSHEIRKAHGDFSILLNAETRLRFIDRLNAFIGSLPVVVIAASIDKFRHIRRYRRPENPYDIALEFCVERLFRWLKESGQQGRLSHVLVERRGNKEDRSLEIVFNNLAERINSIPENPQIALRFMDKKHNSTGLQIADLFAHPISRHVHDRDQHNRAFDLVNPKFRKDKQGNYIGYGLKIFP